MVERATSSRPARKSNGVVPSAALLLVSAIVVALVDGFSYAAPNADGPKQEWKLSPFLEVFLDRNEPQIVLDNVQWATPLGLGRGVLARREPQPAGPAVTDSPLLAHLGARDVQPERYPAIVIIPDHGLRPWHTRTARELAEIGYVALAVELSAPLPSPIPARDGLDAVEQQRVLAELVSTVRWLRRREDVFPDRVGVIGWSGGGAWAAVLAGTTGLQACINCDGPPLDDPALFGELRHTAVMHISSRSTQQHRAFREALQSAEIEHQFVDFDDSATGFMFPENATAYRFDDAERAWFEIYEFFGEHVEDAHIKILLRQRALRQGTSPPPVSTIAELMRAVNTPAGVRGSLAQALRDEPNSDKAWTEVRARAKLLADTADLLQRHEPPRGSATSWLKQIGAYRSAALAIAEAAAKADNAAAGEGLTRLSESCGNCHREHR